MTADLERIAREAGDDWNSTLQSDRDFLARFAALIAADCASILEARAARCSQVLLRDVLLSNAEAVRLRFAQE